MALTKLPKNAFGTGSVDTSKIEDGTIQNVELEGSLTGTQLASTQDYSSKTVTLPNTSVTNDQLAGSIANAKLSNSTFTVRGTSRSLGDSFSIGVDVDWQSVKTTDFTAVAGLGYFVNTTSGAVTVTLPSSASIGDTIAIKDYAGTFATNNLTISRNGHNIQGVANDSLISTNRASVVLVYVDSTKGWLYTGEHNVASLLKAQFTSATGGTITTSGDYKIHTFTGDGCFVVSSAGNSPVNPLGGPAGVEYLVIAGGGAGSGGSGGGGGAGGYRTNYPTPSPSISITATTYPITVGGGGATSTPTNATSGSPSIFSTITSTGGGNGGNYFYAGGVPGASGGSGGGANGGCRSNPIWAATGGSGNTPPTSPSQGNPGGNATTSSTLPAGGGGGGIGASGSNTSGNNAGPGGSGTANSITGSSVTRAGGGGGGNDSRNPGYTVGTGGSGGGGAGGPLSPLAAGGSGTANTGSGGGGGSWNSGCTIGGQGGKGIVIIRYKFQ